jgi:hypothetical protein
MTTKKQAEALAARLGLRIASGNGRHLVYRGDKDVSYYAFTRFTDVLYFASGSAVLLAWLEGWEACEQHRIEDAPGASMTFDNVVASSKFLSRPESNP